MKLMILKESFFNGKKFPSIKKRKHLKRKKNKKTNSGDEEGKEEVEEEKHFHFFSVKRKFKVNFRPFFFTSPHRPPSLSLARASLLPPAGQSTSLHFRKSPFETRANQPEKRIHLIPWSHQTTP